MALVEDDPNTWLVNDWEYRIYADNYANDYAIVDQIDYDLVKYRWQPHESRTWLGTKKPKVYLARTGFESLGKDYKDENGKRIQNKKSYRIFLHTVIMERKGDIKPISDKKIIVDHANGNGFDCRRDNLRYTMIGFNNMNRFGSHEHLLQLGEI